MTDEAAVPTILYARQSKTRERSESLPRQVETGHQSEAIFGLRIVRELVEPPSTSGYKNRGLNRPQWPVLLEAIRSGEGRAVWVYKTDRLSRGGGPGWAPLLETAEKAGLNLDRFVVTPSGWMSEFEIGIRATMDREESKKLSDRMKGVRHSEATKGLPSWGGRRPFGRENDCVTPHPVEAPIIEATVNAILAGKTLYSVARDLNMAGVPTTGGATWTASKLRRALLSPRLAGMREVDGGLMKGNWPPLVAPERWEALRQLLTSPERVWKGPMGRPRTAFLLGLVRCGKCGHALRLTRRYDTQERRYQCPPKGMGGCGGILINATRLEGETRDRLAGIYQDPVIEDRIDVMTPDDVDPRLLNLNAEIGALRVRESRLLDLYEFGDLDRSTYVSRVAKIGNDLDTAQAQLVALVADANVGDVPVGEAFLREWEDWTPDRKGVVAKKALDAIYVKPATRFGRVWDPARLIFVPRGGQPPSLESGRLGSP